MSYGSLGANAISSLNIGAREAGCFHNTGEGGASPYHRLGADICWQIGTGYFGARDDDGNFSLERLVQTVKGCPQIKLIEIKLSQGAKPGKGGVLPAKQVRRRSGDPRCADRQRCISPTGTAPSTTRSR